MLHTPHKVRNDPRGSAHCRTQTTSSVALVSCNQRVLSAQLAVQTLHYQPSTNCADNAAYSQTAAATAGMVLAKDVITADTAAVTGTETGTDTGTDTSTLAAEHC
jgi:hypothetical protein